METNNEDIKLDCEKNNDCKLKFSRKFKVLIGFSIFFTAMSSLAGVLFFTAREEIVEAFGMNEYMFRCLFSLTMTFVCITLIKIAVSKKPFSRMLVRCLYFIGGLLMISGIVGPLLPGFQSLGFELISYGGNYIEGYAFSIGVLFMVFGRIMLYGLDYQSEVDTTI